MSLCKNCKRELGERMCSIPHEKGVLFAWKNHKDVLNVDGTCDFHDPYTVWDRVKDAVRAPYYKIKYKLGDVRDFFRYRVVLRAKHGFDVRDCWHLGIATANFMKPRLKRFIEIGTQGVPMDLVDKETVIAKKLEKYFDGELKDEWFGDDSDAEAAGIAWTNIQKQIYFGIEYLTYQYEDTKVDDRFETVTYTDDDAEIDHEKHDKLRKEVEESFRLLGLFIENLWD